MERIVLRHLTGSKANQVEEFPLSHIKELVLGRDSSATVKYDPDRDDLVGRQHAKISQDPQNPGRFIVADLNSRNGTFVNKQRVTGSTVVNPGDVVQLGPGGPELVFDVEPRPDRSAKATRLASVPTMPGAVPAGPPPTRIPGAAQPTAPYGGSSAAAAGAPAGQVGKATVERMIDQSVSQTKKNQSRKFLLIGGAAFLGVLVVFGAVAGLLVYLSRKATSEVSGQLSTVKNQMETDKANAAIGAAEVNDKYGKAVIYIEVAWRLINTQNQAQVFHQYIPNDRAALSRLMNVNFGSGPIDPTGSAALPVYVAVGDSYEPLLTYTARGDYTKPVGGRHTGTGFIVTNDGFILTNRHVAATWKTSYLFGPDTPKGIVITQNGIHNQLVPPPRDWVPANTRQEGRQLQGDFKGVNDTLDVTLPRKENRIAAQLKQVSDRHDVAMIKIDVPGQVTKVELFDNYEQLKKGESVTILGYPAASPRVYGVIQSQDVFNRTAQLKIIPDPTVTATNIGNIIRDESDTTGKKDKTVSEMGDVIQLATGSTGSGNSGGPVFDDRGRVIGIFFAGDQQNAITYAVPIRYGKEFLAGE